MNYPIYKFNNDYYENESFYSSFLDDFTLSKSPFALTIMIEKFKNKISSEGISLNTNPLTIKYLEDNPKLINWNYLSANPDAINIIKKNKDLISWSSLSMNNCAYKLLKENQDKIDWYNICYNDNPKVVSDIIDKNLDKDISWTILSKNNTDKAIEILLREENKNKIDWEFFSANSNNKAIDILKENKNKIDFEYLVANPNEKIIEIFRENQDKINWYYLSVNSNLRIIEYMCKNFTNKEKKKILKNHISIEKYIDLVASQHIDNDFIYNNWLNLKPYSIYKVDYNKMRENFRDFEEELIKEVYHPKRICKLIENGYDLEDFI